MNFEPSYIVGEVCHTRVPFRFLVWVYGIMEAWSTREMCAPDVLEEVWEVSSHCYQHTPTLAVCVCVCVCKLISHHGLSN